MSLLIRDVARVYRFLVYCDGLDMVERLAYRHFGDKTHVLGGHYRTGGILVKEEQTVYHLSVVLARRLDYPLYYRGGHLLDDIDGIVEIHLLKNRRELSVREALYYSPLGIRVKLDEDVCRHFLTEKSEYYCVVFCLNLREDFGYIYRGYLPEQRLKLCIFLRLNKLGYLARLLYVLLSGNHRLGFLILGILVLRHELHFVKLVLCEKSLSYLVKHLGILLVRVKILIGDYVFISVQGVTVRAVYIKSALLKQFLAHLKRHGLKHLGIWFIY